MQIERRLQPVVEVHAPQRRRSTAHFHRHFVFEQRHSAQLTAARVVAARELANHSVGERRQLLTACSIDQDSATGRGQFVDGVLNTGSECSEKNVTSG